MRRHSSRRGDTGYYLADCQATKSRSARRTRRQRTTRNTQTTPRKTCRLARRRSHVVSAGSASSALVVLSKNIEPTTRSRGTDSQPPDPPVEACLLQWLTLGGKLHT